MEYVSREEFYHFKEEIERKLMAAQSDIDALTQAVDQASTDLATLGTDLTAGIAAVQEQIDNLSANPSLDITALQTAVAALDPAVQMIDAQAKSLASLTPQQPVPPAPAEPTQPVYTFSGDPSTVDTTQWSASGFETVPTDGSAPAVLYYYAGDAANSGVTSTGAGNGADNGAYVQYTGAYQVVPQS